MIGQLPRGDELAGEATRSCNSHFDSQMTIVSNLLLLLLHLLFIFQIVLGKEDDEASLIEDGSDAQLIRVKRQLSKRAFLIGAIFQTDARGTSEYQAFLNYPSSASLIWQNFRVKERIVHVDDVTNSFQMASAICELVADGVIAIFSPINPKTQAIITSMVRQHDVLLLTTSDAHHLDITFASAANRQQSEQNQSSNIVKLRPLKAPAIMDFILYSEWEDVLYLYESQDATYRLRWILERINHEFPSFTADFRHLWRPETVNSAEESHAIGLGEHINPKMSKKVHLRTSIILDLTTAKATKLALKDIERMMPNRADFHFLIVGGDTKEINQSTLHFGGINMTFLSLINTDSSTMRTYLTELNPRARDPIQAHQGNMSYDVALLVDGLRTLVQVLKVLNDQTSSELSRPGEMLTSIGGDTYKPGVHAPCLPISFPPFSASTLFEKLRETTFTGLTGNISFNINGFRDGYAFELLGTKMKQSFSKLGDWSLKGSIVMKSTVKLDNISSGVDLDRLRVVSSILVPPFMMEKKDENGKVIKGEYEGFCVDLVKKLSEMIKFKYKMKVVSDGEFGLPVNGTWTGMIGELLRKEADIVVAPLTITSSRERVVDFSTPFMELGLSVMYQKIERPTPDVLSFMEPLSTDIWMCISFAYLGVSVVLFLVSRLSPAEWGVSMTRLRNSSSRKSGECEAEREEQEEQARTNLGHMDNMFSIFNSFWFALSTFVQQGGDVVPRSLSGRIVGGAWWFFTLIIVSSYTANLAAYLTVERMSNTIKSYEDLSKQTKVKYGVIKAGSSREFFEKSSMKIFQKMWKFMETNPEVLTSSVDEGVERVRKSKKDYAFLLESTMNEYYNQRQPCNTVKVGPNLDSGKGYGLATPPGSDLRDQLNLAVLELKEMDWIASIYRFWWEEKGECGKMDKATDGSATTSSLGLDSVYGLFYLLAGALVTGIFLAILEFIYRCAVDAKRAKRGFGEVFCEMMTSAISDRPQITIPIMMRTARSTASSAATVAMFRTPNAQTSPEIGFPTSLTTVCNDVDEEVNNKNAVQSAKSLLASNEILDKIDYCL